MVVDEHHGPILACQAPRLAEGTEVGDALPAGVAELLRQLAAVDEVIHIAELIVPLALDRLAAVIDHFLHNVAVAADLRAQLADDGPHISRIDVLDGVDAIALHAQAMEID